MCLFHIMARSVPSRKEDGESSKTTTTSKDEPFREDMSSQNGYGNSQATTTSPQDETYLREDTITIPLQEEYLDESAAPLAPPPGVSFLGAAKTLPTEDITLRLERIREDMKNCDQTQVWFVCRESVLTNIYSQFAFPLVRFKGNGDSLQHILEVCILGPKGRRPKPPPGLTYRIRTRKEGRASHWSFYIHSQSMEVVEKLPKDESILLTWDYYCKTDPVVTIVLRRKHEPPPWSSRAPSYTASLRERSEVAAFTKKEVRDIPLAPGCQYQLPVCITKPVSHLNRVIVVLSLFQADSVVSSEADEKAGAKEREQEQKLEKGKGKEKWKDKERADQAHAAYSSIKFIPPEDKRLGFI